MILKINGKWKRSRGNVKRQNKRRKERRSAAVKPLPYSVELIDGNMSKNAVAYCNHYGAYLTVGIIATHRCDKRKCNRLVMIQDG